MRGKSAAASGSHGSPPVTPQSDVERIVQAVLARGGCILEPRVEAWNQRRAWISRTLPPRDDQSDRVLSSALDPLATFRPHYSDQIVVRAEPSLGEEPTNDQAPPTMQCQANEYVPGYELLIATPLLLSDGWRLGLAQLLRELKPGSSVLLQWFAGDGILLDGRIGDWKRWNGETHGQRTNWLCRTLARVLPKVEDEFNRPWRPELCLSRHHPVNEILLSIAGLVLPDVPTPDVSWGEEAVYLRPEARFADLMELPCVSRYLSPEEHSQLRQILQGCLQRPKEGDRDIHLRVGWLLVTQRDPRPGAINRAVRESFIGRHRDLQDAEAYLLPEFNRVPAPPGQERIDLQVLRSLRGFVCRSIYHDRFDPDHHHFFLASLWEPTEHYRSGSFAKATGLVFRTGNAASGAATEEALRQLAYLACTAFNAEVYGRTNRTGSATSAGPTKHTEHQRATLQTFAQTLFATGRPIIRVTISPDSNWRFNHAGDLQLDRECRSESADESALIPEEIQITVPFYEALESDWLQLKDQYLTGPNGILAEQFLVTGTGQSKTLREWLEDQIWPIYPGRMYSLPWNVYRVRASEEDTGFSSTDIAYSSKNCPDRMCRGEPAGIVTTALTAHLIRDYRQGKLLPLTSEFAKTKDDFEAYRDALRELLRDLCFSKAKQGSVLRHARAFYHTFAMLPLTFPAGRHSFQWELEQFPVGAHTIREELTGGMWSEYLVPAGTCLLIRRRNPKLPPNPADEGQADLSSRLANVRSTQLTRRVPTILLPQFSLMVLNRLRAESTQRARLEEVSALTKATAHALKVPMDRARRLAGEDSEIAQLLLRHMGLVELSNFLQDQSKRRRRFGFRAFDPVRDVAPNLARINSDVLLTLARDAAAFLRMPDPLSWPGGPQAWLICEGDWTLISLPGGTTYEWQETEGGALIGLLEELLVNSLRHDAHGVFRITVEARDNQLRVVATNSPKTAYPDEESFRRDVIDPNPEGVVGMRVVLGVPPAMQWGRAIVARTVPEDSARGTGLQHMGFSAPISGHM